MIVVNGSQQALDLTGTGSPGARRSRSPVENPRQYHGTREIFRAAGARLTPVPVDAEGLDPAQLPRHARLAIVTPSHQFPTGAVLPLARRMRLLEWATRANAVIVEDDYEGEFHYEEQPVESLHGLGDSQRVIYIGTFSRTIFPALRIGYLVVPQPLAAAFATAKWLCDRHTPTLEQETLAEFIASGAYERYLRRTRREHARHRTELLDAIARFLGDRVRVTGSGRGDAHLHALKPTRRGQRRVHWPRPLRPRRGDLWRIALLHRTPPARGLSAGVFPDQRADIRDRDPLLRWDRHLGRALVQPRR